MGRRGVGGFTPHPVNMVIAVWAQDRSAHVRVSLALPVKERLVEQPRPFFRDNCPFIEYLVAVSARPVAVHEQEFAGRSVEKNRISDAGFLRTHHAGGLDTVDFKRRRRTEVC